MFILFLTAVWANQPPIQDGFGMSFQSSQSPLGPPFSVLNLQDSHLLSIHEQAVEIELPFGFFWYGEEYERVWVDKNANLSFGELYTGIPTDLCSEEDTIANPSLVAIDYDWQPHSIRYGSFGAYPHRVFAVEWSGTYQDATGESSEGTVQIWLREGENDSLSTIVWDDVRQNEEISDEIIQEDDTASEFIPPSNFSGSLHPEQSFGLALTCDDSEYLEIENHTNIWLGTDFLTSSMKSTSDIDNFFYSNENFMYLGRSLDVQDINGDGFADIAVGTPDNEEVYLLFGDIAVDTNWNGTEQATTKFITENGGEFGYELVLKDINGDGIHDVIVSAPKENSNSGVVYIWDGENLDSVNDTATADVVLLGDASFGSSKSGISLASDDIDGDGYHDLLIGAPYADEPLTNAGAAFLWNGGDIEFDNQSHSLSQSQAIFVGDQLAGFSGEHVFTADSNYDGLSEFVISSSKYDGIEEDVGRASFFVGGEYSGTYDISETAQSHFWGTNYGDKIGVSIEIQDWDGDGSGDLFIGAPYLSDIFSQQGAVFGFSNVHSRMGDLSVLDADFRIDGTQNSSHLGQQIEIFDFDDDMDNDLLISAPNHSEGSVGGGSVVYFDSFPLGVQSYEDADLRLVGSTPGGALGTAIGFGGDINGDGNSDIVVSSPFGDVHNVTGAGKILLWNSGVGFTDADGDGFVSWVNGGLDCDDSNLDIFPSQTESENFIDDDCDGWIDDKLNYRPFEDWWAYQSEAMGIFNPEVYDFEDGIFGDVGSSLYSSQGIHIFSSEAVIINSHIWGTPARDSRALKVINDGNQNQLRVYFDEDVDALGFYALDIDGTLQITTMQDNVVQISDVPIYRSADNKHGGVFVGLIFSSPIDYISFDSTVDNGYGIDDLMVAWSDQSDRDNDGFTEAQGDCDDNNAFVHPQAIENVDNSIDDNCDGSIDAGNATTIQDYDEWIHWIQQNLDIEEGWAPQLIDFEDIALGANTEAQYEELGVHLSGAVIVDDVEGSLPIDTQAAGISSGNSFHIHFQHVQPTVGFSLIDLSGNVIVKGYLEDELLYEQTFALNNEDVDGGNFAAIAFDLGVDELIVSNESQLDIWGMDNIFFMPLGFEDDDGDGFSERDGDCNDEDANVYPGAEEIFYDGIDQDCSESNQGEFVGFDENYDPDYDADGDGYMSSLFGGSDCDDFNVLINPSEEEIWYDGVDQNCDGFNDYDADMDGFATAEYSYGASSEIDCDDGNSNVNPDAEEVFYDDVDDNCNPADDYDADGDGYPSAGYGGAGGMQGGTFVIVDCDDYDPTISPDAEETYYDGIDSDCSGDSTDFDADGDGFDAAIYGGDDCDDSRDDVYPESPFEKWYDGIDSDCLGNNDYDQDEDGYSAEIGGGGDCDDLDPNIHPDAVDVLGDGIDKNCDGLAEFDDDGDGFDGVESGGSDCDDDDSEINPDAEEIFYDGVDQNCDGLSDFDMDGDGFEASAYGGDDCDDEIYSIHVQAEDYPYDGVDQNCDGLSDFDMDGDGFEASGYGGNDCDDFDSMIHPNSMEEYYDGVDQNCDGLSDYDADGDGQDSREYNVVEGVDCDDEDAGVFVGAEEIIGDGVDQNCDGDDDVDMDDDGFLSLNDCDDEDATINSSAVDECYDGVDSDCDGSSDFDCDKDGFDALEFDGTDCNDQNAAISPQAVEIWYDGNDQNCDGQNDFDADGDGYISELYGGEDCEDYHSNIHPDISSDDCGGGNEDCDNQIDEDCGSESSNEEGSSSNEPSEDESDSNTEGTSGSGNSNDSTNEENHDSDETAGEFPSDEEELDDEEIEDEEIEDEEANTENHTSDKGELQSNDEPIALENDGSEDSNEEGENTTGEKGGLGTEEQPSLGCFEDEGSCHTPSEENNGDETNSENNDPNSEDNENETDTTGDKGDFHQDDAPSLDTENTPTESNDSEESDNCNESEDCSGSNSDTCRPSCSLPNEDDNEIGDLNQYYDDEDNENSENSSDNGFSYDDFDTGKEGKGTAFLEQPNRMSCSGCQSSSKEGQFSLMLLSFLSMVFCMRRRHES